jgi:hypothetical protein
MLAAQSTTSRNLIEGSRYGLEVPAEPCARRDISAGILSVDPQHKERQRQVVGALQPFKGLKLLHCYRIAADFLHTVDCHHAADDHSQCAELASRMKDYYVTWT